MSMRSQIGDATFSTVRWEAVREREKREKAEEGSLGCVSFSYRHF